ncbi:MAG: hypothetical protein QOF83_1704 [Solirubrobacteraceae bacterium]|nr:hypothetical protein [Solirubrobacteraceae bacterium]
MPAQRPPVRRIPLPAVLAFLLTVIVGSAATTAMASPPRAQSSHHRAGTHHARVRRSRVHCTRIKARRATGRAHVRCVRRHAATRFVGKQVVATVAANVAAPNVTITSKPPSTTTATTARFTWTTSGTVTKTVCSENGSLWASCASGVTYRAKVGVNQFSVKVSNSSGAKQAYAQWNVTTALAGGGTTTTTATTPTTTPTIPTTTTTTPTTTTPTSATPTPPGVANTFGAGMFGIAAGSTLQNESTTPNLLAQDLTNDQNLGAKWIRIDVNWAQIQYAGAGTYYWTAIDAAVQQAEARGLKVLGTIAYTPNWARPSATTSMYPPNPSQYASFAAAAVAHYAALGVHDYEIWNEENISGFWNSPNPAAYTALLKAAYPAIKGADPAATVILGGLSPAATDGTNYTPPDFLKGVYASGGQGYFDAVGIHPYCWPAYPGDTGAWSAWYQMYGTPTSLRSLMAANGDGSKLIWGTEFGAPTNGPTGSYVSQATQAAMITRAYQLWATYGWAGPLFVYDGRDLGTATTTRENFFGLFNYDFSPKPSYSAYQSAAASL